MMAMTMVAVDITIANVALPHMQSSLSASSDQVIWVLTSYLIASAIATPLSGWLAGRFGRKLVMVISVGGFTLASALCGAANSLTMIVLARVLQGACGAALVPLSQAILLDVHPPEQHAKAMALFAMGSMLGPIVGPTLGGYLTDAMSWRWVFFINIPFGILSFIGMILFVPESRDEKPLRFDMFGFMTVSIALGAFQLMLDRGEHLDWFDSGEIKLYALILGVAVWLGAVHMFTARNTFIRPALFRDRNFTVGCIVSMLLGVVAFATVPLIVIMTQSLLGYSAFRTGMVGLPRAVGTLVAMILVTRLVGRVDTRVLLIAGLIVSAVSMLMYSHFDLYVDQWNLLVAGFIQGIGGGLIFVPLSVIVFATLPQRLRNEGAAMYSLTRNIGNAIGISFLNRELIHYTAQSRARMVEGLRPDSPAVAAGMPDLDFGSLQDMAQMNGEVLRQSAMMGNIEIYYLVFLMSALMIPLILLMQTSRNKSGDGPPAPVME